MKNHMLPPKPNIELLGRKNKRSAYKISRKLILHYLSLRAMTDKGDIIQLSIPSLTYFYQKAYGLSYYERLKLTCTLRQYLRCVLDELKIPYVIEIKRRYAKYYIKREELLKNPHILEYIHYLKALKYAEEVITNG